jgi:DHA2 family multidrug resistance protein-like MFS transporter
LTPVHDGLPTPARYRAMGVIMLGIALSVLDGTIVNLALPGITRELHASAVASVWVINAYQLAAVALLLPCAALGDRIGYRRVYLGGVVIFTAGSVVCFLATSLAVLSTARGVQGVGAAGVMAVNGALVRLIFPSRLLGRGIALNTSVVAASSVAGPSVAALVLSIASWPWLFAINVPLGLLVLLAGWRALPDNPTSQAPRTHWSWLDVVLNALMFGLFFLGVNELGTLKAAAASTGARVAALGLLGGGLAVGFVYLRRQMKHPLPMLAIDLLRIPIFALSMCTSIASFTAQTLAYIALPFLMLDAWGHTPVQAAVLITAWPLTVVMVAPLAGRMIGRFPSGLLGGVGLGLLALGLGLLALLPAHPASPDIVWRMALCGLGFALFQSPNNHTIITSAPQHRSGAAGGMLGTARLTGQSIGAVLLAFIFSIASAHDGRGPVIGLTAAAGFAAVASVFSLLRLRHGSASALD